MSTSVKCARTLDNPFIRSILRTSSRNSSSNVKDLKRCENNNIQHRQQSTVQKLNDKSSSETDSEACSEYDRTSKELNRIKQHFKFPRNMLNNIATKVKNHTGQDMCRPQAYRMYPGNTWSCVDCLIWPEGAKFIGYGRSKQEAAHESACKVLEYLMQTGKITRFGEPIFYSQQEKQSLLKPDPVNISLSNELIEEVREFTSFYNDKIVPYLEIVHQEEKERDIRIQEGLESDINIAEGWGSNKHEVPSYKKKTRNDLLRSRAEYSNEYKTVRESFPIFKYREEFLKLLQEYNVVIVKGEPGCGKSTQIPQYIMEQASLNGSASDCNILITQPRRISAITLAQRIAEERSEKVGDVTGYHIRLNSIFPDRTGGTILFCSTGIALRRMQCDPDLKQCSHIIIDEAHERDADTDTLLLLVKRAMEVNQQLKVIVMSATMNAELFQNYFKNGGALHVPGFTYPVKMNFLEDIQHLQLKKSMQDSENDCPRIHEKEIAQVIDWIDKNKPPGAILCFLPGWKEITDVQKCLEEIRNNSLQILLAHSKLSPDEQRRIFNKPPPNVRKVILSTNICETSITISDVVYVVDCGLHKDKDILPSGLQSIDCKWISQASVNQRKGRAGRVQPGESFHMFSKIRYKHMSVFPTPEILRVPLEKIILDSKTYSRGEYAADYLAEMPEPPPEDRITQAVEELVQMSALNEDEELTPLGRRIAMFALPPKLSKALVHAAIFKCINPMLSICTIYSTEFELFWKMKNSKHEARIIKKKLDKLSDHIAMARLYDCWEHSGRTSFELKVNSERMDKIRQLRQLHADNLYLCGILDRDDFHDDKEATCNEQAQNHELVKAILMSGTDTVLRHSTHKIERGVLRKRSNLRNEFDQLSQFTADSVLNDRAEFPSPFICYISEVHSTQRRKSLISEGSVVSPLTVLLFSDTAVESVTDAKSSYDKRNHDNLQVITLFGKRIQFYCDSAQVDDLLELRTVIWNIFQYFIARQGKEDNEKIWEMMVQYRDNLVDFLGRMLVLIKPKETDTK